MIRLRPGDEPAGLDGARQKGLKQVKALLPAVSPEQRKALEKALTGYRKPVYQILHDRQHGKCPWCERPIGRTSQPVEHVRPKLGADRRTGPDTTFRDPDHYWWLAWTWSNLVLACATCNDGAHKGNWFPLEDGSRRMTAPTVPVVLPLDDAAFDDAGERRLLVHPRFDDPLDHIEWKVANRALPRPRWTWVVEGRDLRGLTTRAVFKLTELEDAVNVHLRQTVLEADRRIRLELERGEQAAARTEWASLLAVSLDEPKALFRGAVWWAIASLWPAAQRAEHGFSDPMRPELTV